MVSPGVLIVGAGVAGPALAHWLARSGWRPTVVERSKELRSGGSAVVLRGPALPVADEMGISPRLRELRTRATHVSLLDAGGRRIARFPLNSDPSRAVEVTRSDLSTVLNRRAADDAEFVFDDTITAIEQDDSGVDVTFRRAAPRRFDLVIGADGIHSAVRRLVFGPEQGFTTDLGMHGATVPLAPGAIDDPNEMIVLGAPGRMLALHPSRDTPLVNFTFRAAPAHEYDRHDVALRKQIVAEAYAGVGWRAPEFIAAYQEHPAPYFDPLTNVRLARWSRGRVALLGDAASAAALLGDGSSMAIAGAHVLSQALAAHPDDHARAFRVYEAKHRREVEKRQRRVGPLASLMVPRTRHGLAVRNAVARAAGFRHSRPTQHTEPASAASTAGSSQLR